MKNKNNLIILLLIASLIVSYLNNLRFQSFRVQTEMFLDTQQRRDLAYRDMNFINSIKIDYPSLGLFGMSLSSQKGTYLIEKDSIFQGIELLKKGAKSNPFIMFSEGQLADISYRIGDTDNFEFYARKAFINMPNNPLHFIFFSRLLKMQNKNDSILYHFNKIKNIVGPKDPQVYNIVLSSFMLDKDTISKYNIKDIAKEAIELHPKTLKLIHDYIVYSRENIDEAERLYSEGMNEIKEGVYNNGLNLLEEALELYPNNQLYFDNYIVANYNVNNFQVIADVYSDYRKYFIDVDSDILYYLASSLYFNENYDISCQLITQIQEKKTYPIDKSTFSYCFSL